MYGYFLEQILRRMSMLKNLLDKILIPQKRKNHPMAGPAGNCKRIF